MIKIENTAKALEATLTKLFSFLEFSFHPHPDKLVQGDGELLYGDQRGTERHV